MYEVEEHIVCFLGHRDCPTDTQTENKLKEVIKNLIENGYYEFWVCDNGLFDWLSRMVLSELNKLYSHLVISFVLSNEVSEFTYTQLSEKYEIIIPEDAIKAAGKLKIIKRNEYIVRNAEVIICYIDHPSGGAYRAVKLAEKLNKKIINIADDPAI